MNIIDLTCIVGIGVMVALFGRGKIYEMAFLAVVVASVWIWHRYSDVVVDPLGSAEVMVGLYIVAGFLSTLVWHVCFSYSVRAKYREFLASALFKKSMDELREVYVKANEEELQQLKNLLMVYNESQFERLAHLNTQFNLLSQDSLRQDLFGFGPTMRLSDTYIPFTGGIYRFADRCLFLYKAEVCEEYLNKLLPPKAGMFAKVLVFVWVFWPVALTWLVCYRLFGLVPAAVKRLGAKLYDGLGKIVFGKV